MPIVSIKMLEGRTQHQKQQLIACITSDIVNICNCNPDAVTIVIEDIPKQNWGSAGIPKA